jgi:hypothetical protein
MTEAIKEFATAGYETPPAMYGEIFTGRVVYYRRGRTGGDAQSREGGGGLNRKGGPKPPLPVPPCRCAFRCCGQTARRRTKATPSRPTPSNARLAGSGTSCANWVLSTSNVSLSGVAMIWLPWLSV